MIISFLLGCICCILSGIFYWKAEHAADLSALTSDTMKQGQYVTGMIDECEVVDIVNLGKGSLSGESQTYLTLLKEYNIYIIPMADGNYIQVMISEEATREEMKKLVFHQKEYPVSFEGITVESPIPVNREWLARIDGFEADKVVSAYMLKEADYEKRKRILWPGLSFLVITVILYAGGGSPFAVQKNGRSR